MNKFFTGRISRGGYFASIFGTLMFIQLFAGVASNIVFFETFYPFTEVVFSFLFLFLIVLFIVLSVKRLHDMDISGLHVLTLLTLIIGGSFILGSIPVVGFILFPAAFSLSALFMSIKKGTVGPNKYGSDPVYRKAPVAPSENK